MHPHIRSFGFALAALLPVGVLAQQPPANGTSTATALAPPVAAVRPHTFNEFGGTRVDQYYWLKDRSNPEVIQYLEAENAYTKAMMAHTEALQERLYEELKGRVLQNDQSVPFREGNYFYYTRLVEGKNYPIYARKRGSLTAPEEIMIDVNALAEGMPIGLLDIDLELSTDRLRPGELLLLYSDGLSECFNEEDKILGVDGLTEMVADIRRAAGRKPDLEWFEGQLKDRLAAHRGRAPASDDISFALALFGA